jgi:hypothetical protein
MTAIKASLPEGTTSAYSDLYAYPTTGNHSDEYYIGAGRYNEDSNELVIYHPGSAFASYHHYYAFEKDNYYAGRSTNSLETSFTPITHTLNITLTGGQATYSSTGEFEFAVAYFHTSDLNTQWNFVMPSSPTGKVVAPKLPEEIKALADIPVFNFTAPGFYTVHEYSDFSSYKACIDAVRATEGGIDVIEGPGKEYAYMEVSIDNPDDGGRKAKTPFSRKSLKERFKTSKRK